MKTVHIDETTDKKFLVKSWVETKEGTFVFETIDKILNFIKKKRIKRRSEK